MNKFLELSFMNYLRNDDSRALDYEACFDKVIEFAEERWSEKVCDDFRELLIDSFTEALYIAGVMGMELAIGVSNGTIKQVIE